MRIDIDDRGHAGLPHRRRAGGEELSGAGGDAPGMLGLRDELGPVAAAQPQQRRRAEQTVGADPVAKLGQQLHRPRFVGARCDHPHQVAEGWIAELAPALELLREKARDVVARRESNRPGVRLKRLHDHLAWGVAPASPRELREQLERPLLSTEVGQAEAGVGIDDRGERDTGEVMPLCHHLRPDQHRARRRRRAGSA